MTKPIVLAGAMALAVLAACSKQAPQEPAAEAAQGAAAPPAAATPDVTSDVTSDVNRIEKLQGLLNLIDTAPQCESFRTRLEEAGKTSPDKPQVDVDQMNRIVAEAHAAGCSRKPGP